MAGRKQHFIRQLLLRGFEATRTQKRKVQVWLYQRDSEPVLVGTDNVFAQRDFYGSAPSAPDERITATEVKLRTVVADLRARATQGVHQIGPSAVIAELMRLSSIRSRWVGTIFEDVGAGTIDAAIDQTKDELSVMSLLKRLIAEEPDYLPSTIAQIFEAQLGRKLAPSEREQVAWMAEYAERNLDGFRELIDPAYLHEQLRDFHPKLKEAATAGHLRGVAQSFDGSEYGRYLEGFSWTVCVEGELPYMLGDCGPLYLDGERNVVGPIGVGDRSEVRCLAMPISRTQLVVGELEPSRAGIDANAVNQASVAWSRHGFVASERSDYCLGLQAVLGSKIDSYLESILDGGLSGSLKSVAASAGGLAKVGIRWQRPQILRSPIFADTVNAGRSLPPCKDDTQGFELRQRRSAPPLCL
jgi:hypothetical protein